jgi:alpha-glucosidase
MQADESLEWLDLGGDVIAFRRGSGVVCVVNFGERAVTLPDGEMLVSSEQIVDGCLPRDAACWLARA